MSIELSEAEWRARLAPEQYASLRNKATEVPFTGKLLHNSRSGIYTCAACAQPLFHSNAKFESGSGWPSFYDVISRGAIKLLPDSSHGMNRTEIVCANCGGHLGHIFLTDKLPTNTYYCVNSASLAFNEAPRPEKSPNEIRDNTSRPK